MRTVPHTNRFTFAVDPTSIQQHAMAGDSQQRHNLQPTDYVAFYVPVSSLAHTALGPGRIAQPGPAPAVVLVPLGMRHAGGIINARRCGTTGSHTVHPADLR